jgi:hypothetical protein
MKRLTLASVLTVELRKGGMGTEFRQEPSLQYIRDNGGLL